MTKEEKKQFCEAWLEIENLITIIDPHFQPEKSLKRPEAAGMKEFKDLLQFLRVLIRLTLHDKESCQRERDSFYGMLQKIKEQE